MPATWLEQMLDACAVYAPVREHGVIVDFEETYLNAAGRVARMLSARDATESSLVSMAPMLRESGLFDHYVAVAETGIPWSGKAHLYQDHLGVGLYDIQAWRVDEGIALTWRDVTDTERLAARLRESEERFRTTIHQLPDAISAFAAVRDEQGGIVDFRWLYVNPAGVELTGFAESDLVGRTLLEMFPEAARSGMVEHYAAVVATGTTWVEDTMWHTHRTGPDGPLRRALRMRASKVGDGVVVVSRDVTADRLVQQQLEVATACLSALSGVTRVSVPGVLPPGWTPHLDLSGPLTG